jgi:hypothetical protein
LEGKPYADLAIERFLRLVAANVGQQATTDEVVRILEEILGPDVRHVDSDRLVELADLLAVAAGVGAGWTHAIANEEEDGVPLSLQDAMASLEHAIRGALREDPGH